MVGRNLSEVTDAKGMQALSKAVTETRALEEQNEGIGGHFFPFGFLGLHKRC